MKTILVTGGCGFIGSNFINIALEKDKTLEVINVDKATYAANIDAFDEIDHNRYAWAMEDINHFQFRAAIDIGEVDCIIHFAAESHVDRSISDPTTFIDTNINGTIQLLEGIKNSNRKPTLIYMGTDEVYGSLGLEDLNQQFHEDSPFRPSSPYSASKAAAECFVMAYGATYNLPYMIVNCANVYGPRQHAEKLIPKIITKATNNETIPVYGEGTNQRQWTYVDDVVEALLLVMEKGKNGERYNIASSDLNINNLALTRLILRQMNKPFSLIEMVKDRPGHDLRYSVNTDKLRALGFEPKTQLLEGLSKTINWYVK